MTCDSSGAMRLLGNLPNRVRLIEADFLAKVGDRFCEVARDTKTYNDADSVAERVRVKDLQPCTRPSRNSPPTAPHSL